jgi:hypothetical protein
MQKVKQKLGFSLLELSVVFIVVGIIIAGISKGGGLILEKSKLAAARSLTKTAPVTSNPNLILWLETSLPESFDSEPQSGDLISTWNDLSPYLKEKNDAIQVNSDFMPTFQEGAINRLPTIRFDGNDNHLIINEFELREAGTGGYAIFMILKKEDLVSTGELFTYRSSPNDDNIVVYYHSADTIGYRMKIDNSNIFFATGAVLNGLATNFHLLTVVGDLENNHILSINGTQYTNTNDSSRDLAEVDFDVPFFIGSSHNDSFDPTAAFDGDIAEIIVYNKYIKTSTRENIEEYLSRKYNITLN